MDSARRKYRSIPQRLVRFLLIATFQIVLVLTVLEIGARIIDPMGISYYPETARFLDTMIHEEPIGYRLQPGLDARFNGARYQVNSLGFRGDELPPIKPANEKRIVWLGDSVVFGIGVNNDETLAANVERMANARGGETLYRVLNLGVPSYNTEQELIQFESLGLDLEPDAVILLFAQNDIEEKKWVFNKRSNIFADIAQRSYALSTIFIGSRMLVQRSGGGSPQINVQAYEASNPRWLAISNSLAKIKELCDKRSIPFAVFVIGTVDEPMLDQVAAEGKRLGIDVVGIAPELDARWPDALDRKYRNSPVDNHPNAAGTRIWATVVYEYLIGSGIIVDTAKR